MTILEFRIVTNGAVYKIQQQAEPGIWIDAIGELPFSTLAECVARKKWLERLHGGDDWREVTLAEQQEAASSRMWGAQIGCKPVLA